MHAAPPPRLAPRSQQCPSRPASSPHRDCLVMCSEVTSTNREVTEPRFQSNMDTNISKEINKKNMGVMSTNLCKTVRSRAQLVTSWNGQFQLLQITRIKNQRDLRVMKTNQLGCSIVESKCHTAQVRGDPQEQEEGRPPSTETLCRRLELPQHMPRLYLALGGGGIIGSHKVIFPNRIISGNLTQK
jgi:hypothetical protein